MQFRRRRLANLADNIVRFDRGQMRGRDTVTAVMHILSEYLQGGE